MTTTSGKQPFLTEVFPAELDEIRRWRAAVHLEASALDGATQPLRPRATGYRIRPSSTPGRDAAVHCYRAGLDRATGCARP